jgi:hypothetical protein
MELLDRGLAMVRDGHSYQHAAETIVKEKLAAGERVPGIGHRLHTHDPRALKLLAMAYELDLEGEHVRLMRVVDQALAEALGPDHARVHVNVDGAIAAICGDLGLDHEFGNALFIISRVPGLIAHAHEERLRERPMRAIDPKNHQYDGPPERRLPQTRKGHDRHPRPRALTSQVPRLGSGSRRICAASSGPDLSGRAAASGRQLSKGFSGAAGGAPGRGQQRQQRRGVIEHLSRRMFMSPGDARQLSPLSRRHRNRGRSWAECLPVLDRVGADRA